MSRQLEIVRKKSSVIVQRTTLSLCLLTCPFTASVFGEDAKCRVPSALANDFTVVYESPDPADVYAYSPGLIQLPGGRLIATMDQGGRGVKKLPNISRDGLLWRGRIYASDDGGKTWCLKAESPMLHARPFLAGDSVYVLGHQGRLIVVRSDDNGDTWSAPAFLTGSTGWHQAPCNVWYANGRVYLVMERKTDPAAKGWPVAALAPVVMSAPVAADLTKRESWAFSNEYCFRDAVKEFGRPSGKGLPQRQSNNVSPGARFPRSGLLNM